MNGTAIHSQVQYAIRLPNNQLYHAERSGYVNIVHDEAVIWSQREEADRAFVALRRNAVSTGTVEEFDAGAAVVQRTVLVIGLPFQEVS
ncbi:hypothetical protein [Nocardia alni]|uniref:hypothetical protein n=1 Tax=Nocardia alni TaxID=2815723 RepID=UPI001C235EB0|nr:hypothetical protein [Nocardia alni]